MKRNHHPTLLAIAFIVTLIFSVAPAVSQDKPANTMNLLREKLRADKKLFVAEVMQLTESEAKAFWPVYEDYQKDLGKLRAVLQRMIEEYANHYKDISNAAAKKLVDDYLSLEEERLKIMRSHLSRFRKAISEKKVALYYQLENKINAAINYEVAEAVPPIW